MGITNVTIASLKEVLPNTLTDLKVCELGDQRFYLGTSFTYMGVEMTFLKSYFEYNGAMHHSIDWHGENGALKLDFRKEVPFKERYDMLTNFGFTEHVTYQYA